MPALPVIDQSDKIFGSGPVLKYIAAGDSTAAGVGASGLLTTYPYQVAQYLAKDHTVEYKNIGHIGDTTNDVLNNQVEQIIAYKPDVITISMGGNDATHLVSENKIIGNYKNIIARLEKDTTAKIYIMDIGDFHGVTLLPWFYVQLIEFRSSYINPKIISLETTRTKIVNIHDYRFRDYGDLRTTYAADGFHPNDIGYENWYHGFLDRMK